MKRILFLDIDGVLNHDYWYESIHNKTNDPYYHRDIDPGCINCLNLLPNNVEIVISSSRSFEPETVDMLNGSGLKLQIIGGTDHYHYDWICRGNEIQKWIIDNLKYQSYRYAILDDDSDMLLSQKDNFVLVPRSHGLNRSHIDKVKRILNIK